MTDSVLTIHPWLEYQDLVKLVKQMDYLFIAREITQTTLTNFPSKVPEMAFYGVIPLVSRVGRLYRPVFDRWKRQVDVLKAVRRKTVKALRRAIGLSKEKRSEMRLNARKTAEEKFDYVVFGLKRLVNL